MQILRFFIGFTTLSSRCHMLFIFISQSLLHVFAFFYCVVGGELRGWLRPDEGGVQVSPEAWGGAGGWEGWSFWLAGS